MFLYSAGRDPSKEKWDGASTRLADVVAIFGADDARPLENLADDLRTLAARAEHVYVDSDVAPGQRQHHHHARRHHRRRASSGTSGTGFLHRYLSPRGQASDSEEGSYLDAIAPSKRRPLAPLVGALRSVKSSCELEVMKAAAEISARAHAKVSCLFLAGFVGRMV
jgi:intermediate cleaving peptidase 55